MDQRRSAPAMGGTEWALLLVLSVLWGGSFFLIKILGQAVPPFTVVLGRVGLAAVALQVLLLVRRDPIPLDVRLWVRFGALGVLNNVVPFSLIVFGETRISSGLASILNATTPIFGLLVAHWLTADERLTPARGCGVLFGFLGVAVLLGPSALSGSGGGGRLVGELACLAAALAYAFAGVYGRRFRGIAPLKVATGQVTASTVVLLPIVAVADRPWTLPAPGIDVWLAFAGISLVSTAVAFVLFFRILAVAGATNVLLVTLLVPVSAMGLGVAFLGEVVTWQALSGLALIGAGLAAIDGRILRVFRRAMATRSVDVRG